MSDWSYPLCGCFSDCSTCLITYFCPCVAVGNVAEAVGENKTLCCIGSLAALYFLPIAHLGIRIYLRNKLRSQKGIEGSIIKDCLCVYFCPLCSLVQEAREAKEPGGQAMARE